MESRMLAAVAEGGGLVTAARLRALGIGSRTITAWVRAGELVAVRRGVYTTRELWESWDDYHDRPLAQIRAVDLTLRVPHVFSHDSGGHIHRLPLLRPQRVAVHVTRPDLRGSRTKAGVRHHGARYPEERLVEVDSLPVLDIPRTVVDLTREHGYRAGLVAADGAMQLGITRRELAAAAREAAGWPWSLTANAVVKDADPGAESAAETLGRELVEEAGLGPVETQFPVKIPGGVAWLDMRVGCHGLEIDGQVKILSPAAGGVAEKDAAQVLWEERKRQHLVCAEGLGMSRLGWEDFWGDARERAKERIRAEYAVTVQRFGTELPAHLAEFAARMRGKRYPTTG